MPKISDIEETPNPNAVKFILREAVSNGTAHSYPSRTQAQDDPLAKALFDVDHVVSVFYMDRMITVEKDDEGDWDDLLPTLAVPIRVAESVTSPAGAAAAAGAAVGGSIGAITSDDPRLLKINDILDEKGGQQGSTMGHFVLLKGKLKIGWSQLLTRVRRKSVPEKIRAKIF